MNFTLFPDTFAIARMPASEAMPKWVEGGPLVSITRTASEMSIVCRERSVPAGTHADRGWQCLRADGPFPLSAVGIAAEFTSILAKAHISVFVIATYDTDYVLVKGDRMPFAVDALKGAGHSVQRA